MRFLTASAITAVLLAPSLSIEAIAAFRIGVPKAPIYKCVGKEITLSNSNTDAVQNGGTPGSVNTGGRSYCVLQIVDYHWNGGQGATPGTVGLTVVSGLGG